MITIDSESRLRVRYPFEIDNMAKRYKTESTYFTFTSPSLSVLEKYYYYLLRNSTEKQFSSRYKYKPSYLAYDEYGVTNLGFLLMYMNNIQCVEDFDLVSVIIPSMDSIVTMCQDKVPQVKVDKLESVSL